MCKPLHSRIQFIIFSLFFISASYGNPIKIDEALYTKKINISIKGNGNSTHYLEPVIIEVSNISKTDLSLSVQYGDLFIPTDESKQNIIVTDSEVIALKPNEKKSVRIKGMCIEPNDASGNGETVYMFKAVNDEKLKKLSDFIAQHKYQSSAAQFAVWCLVSDGDINSIYSADSTEENNLKRFMAALTGKTFAVKSKDYKTNYYAPPKEKVGGNFEYSFTKAQDIQIAMFNENGILVRELLNKKNVPAGTHHLSFEYDSSVYTDDIYYFKLIAGNDVMVNRKWNAKAMRDAFKQKYENRE